jgi:hypothetical protein
MGTLGRAIFTVGRWIRGTGQAMDRLGSTIQGGRRIEEQRKHLPLPATSLLRCRLLAPACALRLLRPSDWDRVFVESFCFGAALILFHRSVLSVRCLGALVKRSDWLSVIRVRMLCSQLWICWQM